MGLTPPPSAPAPAQDSASDVSAQLFSAWRAGDERAGNDLFTRHFDSLYRFFRNKVETGAEDLVQQTFLACISAEESYRGEASFRTYLFTVAKSKLYEHLRRRQRNDARWDPLEHSMEASGESPSILLAGKEEHLELRAALNGIPLELQIAIELFYFEDLSAPEIARVLDVPEGTVRSRLRRALALLRDRVRVTPMAFAERTLTLVDQVEQKLA